MSPRSVSLAAATLGSPLPVDSVRAAADAGFDRVGLRPDPEHLGEGDAAEVSRRAEAAGVRVLDVEVARVGTTPPEVIDRLVDYAAAVQAAHLLVVSDDDDRTRTVDGFRRICERSEGTGVRPVLEFMRFSAVGNLAAALEVVSAADHPLGAVLVDPLHLARSGGRPDDLVGITPSLLPYVQLCDGPADGAAGLDGLAWEARHNRLLPGDGELPLGELLALTPDVPVSVEVPSDAGRETATTEEWVGRALAAAMAVIAQVDTGNRPR